MSTITISDIPLTADGPAQRLRRMATASRVHLRWWGTHKTLTAQQKEEVSAACSADVRFLTAGKKLIDTKHEAFRRLTSIRTRIISFWRGLTLPFVEPGVRLLRQSDVGNFVGMMEEFKTGLHDAEADLNAVYDEIKAGARQRLGRLYNPSDYPPLVQGLFDVEWDFLNLEPPSYLMQIHPEVYRQEQVRISARFDEAVRLAEQAFIAELSGLISHMTERLGGGDDGEKKIFRDSVVGNLVEFFDRFRALNVHSNAQLDQLVEQAQNVVRGVEPQELRDNDGLRRHIATQISAVASQLDGMMVSQPRRRIVRAQREAS